MIAIVNNCERFRELAEELKERWWKPGYRDNDADIAYNTLISTYKVCARYEVLLGTTNFAQK